MGWKYEQFKSVAPEAPKNNNSAPKAPEIEKSAPKAPMGWLITLNHEQSLEMIEDCRALFKTIKVPLKTCGYYWGLCEIIVN